MHVNEQTIGKNIATAKDIRKRLQIRRPESSWRKPENKGAPLQFQLRSPLGCSLRLPKGGRTQFEQRFIKQGRSERERWVGSLAARFDRNSPAPLLSRFEESSPTSLLLSFPCIEEEQE